MLLRLAEHYVAFRHPEGHKYQILAEAKRKGYTVCMDVLYYATGDSEEEIGQAEGEFIRRYRPALNTQIPKESDWRKFDYNSSATTITLDEILGSGK